MTEEQKEFAYYHHASNMYNKEKLLEMIRENLKSEDAVDTLSHVWVFMKHCTE